MKYLTLFSNYLPIKNPKSTGFTGIRCPFHEDKDPSAGIDLASGVFNCRSCGLNLSATSFIAKFSGKTLPEAGTIVDSYRIDNNIKLEVNNFSKRFVLAQENPEWLDLYQLSKRCDLNETFATDFARERGIPINLLIEEGIGFLPAAAVSQWNRDSLVFPYFYGGKLVGLRFRDEEGSKSGLEDSLMVPYGIDSVRVSDKQLLIVEGESDRLKLITELRKQQLDYPVIGFPGGFFKQEWLRDFNGIDSIAVIPDSDNGGDNLVKQLKKFIPNRYELIELPWLRRQLGKDLTDWFAENHDDPTLINQIVKVFSKTVHVGPLNTQDFLNDEGNQNDTLIHNLMLEGQMGLVAGKQKSKKTMAGLNIVRALLSPQTELFGIPSLISSDKLPTILYLQTEGAKRKFQERVKLVMEDVERSDLVNWWFKPGIRLPIDVKILEDKIRETGASVVFLDPYQNLATGEENSSTGQAPFWQCLHDLNYEFPLVTFIVFHHFGKDGDISQGFEALRGSGRMGGEVDWVILIEDRPKSESNNGSKVKFLFRDEPDLVSVDGKDIFKLNFSDNLIFHMDAAEILMDKSSMIIEEIKSRGGTCNFKELLAFMGVTEPTLNHWIKKSTQLSKTTASPGHPVMVIYNPLAN